MLSCHNITITCAWKRVPCRRWAPVKVNMGTLANRLDKLDNKFGLIEREAGNVDGGRGCDILPSVWPFVPNRLQFVSFLVPSVGGHHCCNDGGIRSQHRHQLRLRVQADAFMLPPLCQIPWWTGICSLAAFAGTWVQEENYLRHYRLDRFDPKLCFEVRHLTGHDPTLAKRPAPWSL